MRLKKFSELHEAAIDAIKIITVITDDGKLIKKEGYAEEGVGIFDYEGIEYPAGIDFKGRLHAKNTDGDKVLSLDGKNIIPDIKKGVVYKPVLESNVENEKDIIENVLCPYFVKKYNSLLDWGKKKTSISGVEADKIIFEKRNEDSNWSVIIIGGGWSRNETNRIVQYIVTREFVKFAKENGIKIKDVTNAGAHSVGDAFDSFTYEVNK